MNKIDENTNFDELIKKIIILINSDDYHDNYEILEFFKNIIKDYNIEILIKILEILDINMINDKNDIIIIGIQSNNILILNAILKKLIDPFDDKNIIIYIAIQFNNIEILNKILEFYNVDMSLDQYNHNDITNFFYYAIQSNNIDIINKISELFNINVSYNDINYLFQNAITTNNFDRLNQILGKITITNFDLNDVEIYILISIAIKSDNIEILNKSFEKLINPNLNISNKLLINLIYLGIKSDNINILDKVLDKADISFLDRSNLAIYNEVINLIKTIKTHNIEILYKILEFYNINITLNLLFEIIIFYKDIINHRKESNQSIIILNKIIGKIDDNIINKDFYIEFCDLMKTSGIFYVIGMNNKNINSVNILKIIQKFSYLNDNKFMEVIKQKKINPNKLTTDINSHIASFLSNTNKYYKHKDKHLNKPKKNTMFIKYFNLSFNYFNNLFFKIKKFLFNY